jgi:phosphatidylglycerol:prolipoprotein diacylglycerol transferase
MYPELFHIGPLAIRSYGVALAISFFLGVAYIKYLTSRMNRPFEPFLNIAYIIIFGGVVGARLFYVLTHTSDFSDNWWSSFNPFQGDEFGIAGLNLYGGVILALIGIWVYCRVKKMSILDVFDFFSPTLGIGLALTRVGCFLNGCCFGIPTDLPWGVSFPTGSIPFFIFGDAHLHPSQVYSSLYGILLFLILHFKMRHRRFHGQLVAIMFMVEAAFRYAIEYVRYYESEMHISLFGMNPTYNHIISIALFLTGATIYVVQRRKAQTQGASALD